jgi:sensor histidine kinase YesM
LQPFVENSIHHGLLYLPKNRQGQVHISIKEDREGIQIRISDNGIGRRKAREIKNSTGGRRRSHSGQILDELKQTCNLLPGCEIQVEIIDKEDEEKQAQGTCVFIHLKINEELVI